MDQLGRAEVARPRLPLKGLKVQALRAARAGVFAAGISDGTRSP
jgi:hypothetical protein